jgi:hypothetical protein
MLLNTLVTTITAVSTVSGNIAVNEADDLVIHRISANNGGVAVTGGGSITAHRVETIQDGAANNVVLKSGKNISIGSLEAAVATGAQKTTATVTVDAAGLISELAGDSAANEVDVFAYSITLRDSTGAPAYVVINEPTDLGSASALEVAFTKTGTQGVTTGATTVQANDVFASGGGVVEATVETTQPAGTDAKQVSVVAFANVLDTDLAGSPAYRYTVTVNGTAYVVEAGVDGVTNTWSSILGAFKTQIEAAGDVTVAVEAGQRKLVLEVAAVNTSFTVGLVKIERIDSGEVEGAVRLPGVGTQEPGPYVNQGSEVIFPNAALAPDSVFTVIVNGHVYTARVGNNQIISITGADAAVIRVEEFKADPSLGTPPVIAAATSDSDRTIDLSAVTVADNTKYTVTIDSKAFDFTTGASATLSAWQQGWPMPLPTTPQPATRPAPLAVSSLSPTAPVRYPSPRPSPTPRSARPIAPSISAP